MVMNIFYFKNLPKPLLIDKSFSERWKKEVIETVEYECGILLNDYSYTDHDDGFALIANGITLEKEDEITSILSKVYGAVKMHRQPYESC